MIGKSIKGFRKEGNVIQVTRGQIGSNERLAFTSNHHVTTEDVRAMAFDGLNTPSKGGVFIWVPEDQSNATLICCGGVRCIYRIALAVARVNRGASRDAELS